MTLNPEASQRSRQSRASAWGPRAEEGGPQERWIILYTTGLAFLSGPLCDPSQKVLEVTPPPPDRRPPAMGAPMLLYSALKHL